MKKAWSTVEGIDISSSNVKDFIQATKPCHHSKAIEVLHEMGHFAYPSIMDDSPSFINTEVRAYPYVFDIATDGVSLVVDSGEGGSHLSPLMSEPKSYPMHLV